MSSNQSESTFVISDDDNSIDEVIFISESVPGAGTLKSLFGARSVHEN